MTETKISITEESQFPKDDAQRKTTIDPKDAARAREKVLKRFKGHPDLSRSGYFNNGELLIRATSGSAEKIYEKDFRIFEDFCLFLGRKSDFSDLMIRNLVAFKGIYREDRHDFRATCDFMDTIYNVFVIAQEWQEEDNPQKNTDANMMREKLLNILHDIKSTAQTRDWQKKTPDYQKINLITGRKTEVLNIIGQYLNDPKITAERLDSLVRKLREKQKTPATVTVEIREKIEENEEAA
jgi:hypothetical protein